MNKQQAIQAIERYFSLHVEANCIWQEITENGIITKEHIQLMDDETLINVGEDLAEQLHKELYEY